eukprot:GHVP01053285.1.p1 GENE.GHVP01053285.1~~GHVP01053285.1.p1  ORF type:complete len:526 (-),score=103.66 GHVP01053285.1:26-1603(-)
MQHKMDSKTKFSNFQEDVQKAVLSRTYEENLSYIRQETEVSYIIDIGFVPNMKVPAKFYANEELIQLLYSELKEFHTSKKGGFLPSIVQISNVAALSGVVGYSLGLPDIHSGYGFAVGNCAAIDLDTPGAIISPGGIGFDIGCGVRLLKTNLELKDIKGKEAELIDKIGSLVPAGVFKNNKSVISIKDMNDVLTKGMKWALDKGFCWPEDIEVCEDFGCVEGVNAKQVSNEAKERGKSQLGTLGAGNHYIEIQEVVDIHDMETSSVMGLTKTGQITIMIHTGSRGFGHKICSSMTARINQEGLNCDVNDRQLAGLFVQSKEGIEYINEMNSAINFAYVNRTIITHRVRKAFEEVFQKSARDLGMDVIYDVSHNTAKVENHVVNGEAKRLLVHRKGSTRAFGPGSMEIPRQYRKIGQPVIVGGSMGSYSYILVGTDRAMKESFGTTCHGAGRRMSRTAAEKTLDTSVVIKELKDHGVFIYKGVSDKELVQESVKAYKDIDEVVETCQKAGLSDIVVKVKPICVLKG